MGRQEPVSKQRQRSGGPSMKVPGDGKTVKPLRRDARHETAGVHADAMQPAGDRKYGK